MPNLERPEELNLLVLRLLEFHPKAGVRCLDNKDHICTFNYHVGTYISQSLLRSLLNSLIMEDLLYFFAIILVIAWLIGFLGYSAGGLIHILLVIALIAVLLRVIRGRTREL